jgi:hypothetical protein
LAKKIASDKGIQLNQVKVQEKWTHYKSDVENFTTPPAPQQADNATPKRKLLPLCCCT